jgi:hypothetical protein
MQLPCRHMCGITVTQALEHEEQLIRGLPLEELDALVTKRNAAATTIQACWRGARQRQQLRATLPAFVSSFCRTWCTATALETCLWLHYTHVITTCLSQPTPAHRQVTSNCKLSTAMVLLTAILCALAYAAGWPASHHLLLAYAPRRAVRLLAEQQQ